MKIVLLADTVPTRTKGLMFHKPLEMDECAFFIFPAEGRHTFWNKNVDFPISLLFCDKHGEIQDIKYLEKQQEQPIVGDHNKILYVIETHYDFPKKNKIEQGKKMKVVNKEILFSV